MAGDKKGYELFNQQELLQDMKAILTDIQKQGIDDELAERVLETFQSSIRTYEMVLDAQSSIVESYEGEDIETKLKQEIIGLRQKNLREHQRNNDLSKDLMSLRQKEEFKKFVDELWDAILQNPPLAEKVFKIEFSLGENPSKTQVLTKKVDFVLAHFLDVSKANEHFGSTLTKYATLANNAEAQADKSAKKAQKLEAKLASTSKKLKDTYEAFEDVNNKWQDSNEQYFELEKKTKEELAQAKNVRKDLESDLNDTLAALDKTKDELTSSESKVASSEEKLRKVNDKLSEETKLRQAYERVYTAIKDMMPDKASSELAELIKSDDPEISKLIKGLLKEIFVQKFILADAEERCSRSERAVQAILGDDAFKEYKDFIGNASEHYAWIFETHKDQFVKPLEKARKTIESMQEETSLLKDAFLDVVRSVQINGDKGVLEAAFDETSDESYQDPMEYIKSKIPYVIEQVSKYNAEKHSLQKTINSLEKEVVKLKKDLEAACVKFVPPEIPVETIIKNANTHRNMARLYERKDQKRSAVSQYKKALALYDKAFVKSSENEKEAMTALINICNESLKKLEAKQNES